MSESKDTVSISGLGTTLLGILFIGLKLTGHIDWSWLWVLAPFWGPVALALVILVVVAAAFIIGIKAAVK